MNRLFIFFIVLFTGLFFDRLDIFKICLLSSAFHEAGHTIIYKLFIGKWPEIEISLFGFKMKNIVAHNKYYVFIVIRGPLVNLFLLIFSLTLYNNKATFEGYIWIIVNLIIFIINMLPVWFLDGGQILYCLSPIYQRNYRILSFFIITVITVMLFCFTGVKLSLIALYIYFLLNVLNDI